MKPITKWYKQHINEAGIVTGRTFNHYDDGHMETDYPLPFHPSFSNQFAWKNDKWEKEHAYITDDMKIV